MRKLLLSLIIVAFSLSAISQSFTQVSTAMIGTNDDAAEWGDYDNDGDLDLFNSGRIYKNNGNNSFVLQSSISIPYFIICKADWGDYNNDGFLDIAICGRQSANALIVTKIYKNNGNNTFTELSNLTLSGLWEGDIEWGDLDNDGDLDLFVCGRISNGSYITEGNLYENLGNNSFQLKQSISPFQNSFELGDYDNDGDLDILKNSIISHLIYKNDGDWKFDAIYDNILYTSGYGGYCKWIDFDSDGDLDYVLFNNTGNGYNVLLGKNIGNDAFDLDGTNAYNAANTYCGFGDFNNNGSIDIAISSSTGIWIIERSGSSYTSSFITPLGGTDGTISCADINNDNKLDFILTGFTTYVTNVFFINNDTNSNLSPQQPIINSVDVNGRDFAINFSAPFDDKTLSQALTYDYYLENTTSSTILHYPNANVNTGLRSKATKGQNNKSQIIINGLNYNMNDTLLFKVQAIDLLYAGSQFSQMDTIVVPLLAYCGKDTVIDEGASFQRVAEDNSSTSSLPLSYQWSPYIGLSNDTISNPVFSPSITTTYTLTISTVGSIASDTLIVYVKNNIYQTVVNGISSANSGNVSWINLDGDSLLDISIITGNQGNSVAASLLRNTGNGNFTPLSNINLPSLQSPNSIWGDVNQDGFMDVFINNYNVGSGSVTQLYFGNGSSTFVNSNNSFINLGSATTSMYDVDNDGDLDLLIMGWPTNNNNPTSRLYINNMPDSLGFTEKQLFGISALNNGSIDWGDYNNDGYADIIITGSHLATVNETTKIYKNNGDGTFTEEPQDFLVDVHYGDAKWGDYDSDGNLDFALCGKVNNKSITQIYRNEGSNVFALQNTISLLNVRDGSVHWGDYDNDGDLDLLLSGSDGYGASATGVTRIYRNEGKNIFIDQLDTALGGLSKSTSYFGDYDNDNDLDIITYGKMANGYNTTRIYKNSIALQNTAPSIPINLTTLAIGNNLLFKWNSCNDAQTSSKALTYNISIGSQTGMVDMKSPEINNYNQRKLMPGMGNVQLDTTFLITREVSLGDSIYWSVQSVDNAYLTSAMSQEQLSVINLMVKLPDDTIISFNNTFQLNPVVSYAGSGSLSYHWSPSIGVSDTSLLNPVFTCLDTVSYTLTVNSTEGYIAIDQITIYRVDSVFSNQIQINIQGLTGGKTDWGDYDNDGDLDFITMGYISSGSYATFVYKNEGNNNFTEQTAISIMAATRGGLDWGDYDNDGFLDILITGQTAAGEKSKVYRNNGNGNFVEQTSIQLLDLSYGDCQWIDYNNDGLIDIAIMGKNGTVNYTQIYKNNGNNSFALQSGIQIIGLKRSSMDWGDYNNDGFDDLLITGYTAQGTLAAKLYKNNGNNTFTDQTSAQIYGMQYASLKWGDYNNDGLLDILSSGSTSTMYNSGSTRFYKNNGNNTFSIVQLITSKFGSIEWIDFNSDGLLDIIYSGKALYTPYITMLYQNDGNGGYFVRETLSYKSLIRVYMTSADYDNDGDLDFLFQGGLDFNSSYSILYKNCLNQANVAPSIPSQLVASVSGNILDIGWNQSSDTQTPTTSISYNLNIGTSQGQTNIMSANTIMTNDFHKTAEIGNVGFSNSFSIPTSSFNIGDTAYINVQAIDNGLQVSGLSQTMVLPICNGASYSYMDDTICSGDSLGLFGVYYSNTGSYIAQNNASSGCDSIVNLSLHLVPKPSSFNILGDTLPVEFQSYVYTAPLNSSVSYNWSANNANILSTPSANTVMVKWDSNGVGSIMSYALNNYGCKSDTSVLSMSILINSISSININSFFNVFPIPSKGIINIESIKPQSINYKLLLINAEGKLLLKKENINQKNYKLDLSKYNKGIYYLRLVNENGVVLKQVILM